MARSLKENIAWLSGILEGEGCFGGGREPSIQLAMTDRDIVVRVANMFGANVTGPYKQSGFRTYRAAKMYRCTLGGYKAIAWMIILYRFFGSRRQIKIKKILEKWPPKGYDSARIRA